MKYILMDFGRFEDMRSVHDFLAREFMFPDYYGRNLDALYDCLTDLDYRAALILMNVPQNPSALEGRLEGFLRVLNSSMEDNPNFIVKTI